MPGTAAGARKGWRTKREATPSPAREKTRLLLQQTKFLERVTQLQAQEESRSGYFSGLHVNLRKIEEEYVPGLTRLNERVDLFEKMANDPAIKKQLRLNILPLISNVRWKVEGGTQESQDLVRANLLREGDSRFWCDTSWKQRLFEHLQCLKYGFSAHGKTWRVVDGYRVYGRLTYLHPRTFKGTLGPWEWNDVGELIAVHRTFRTPETQRQIVDERLPIEDVFIMAWELTGENWEGTALIRSMYRAFVEKDLLARIQMINYQNVGVAIPDAEMAPGDGPKDRDSLESIVRSMRGGSKERQYIVRSSGQKVGYATAQNVVDVGPAINSRDLDIFGGGGTEQMSGGQSQMGSRANASVQQTMNLVLVDSVRACVEDAINHGMGYLPGLVEEMLRANFTGSKEQETRIVGSRVSPSDQLDNVNLIGELTRAGAIPRNRTTANELLARLGYTELTQEEYDAGVGARSPVDIGTPSGQPEGGAPNPGGRPPTVQKSGAPPDPRKDTAATRYGLAAQEGGAQKKSPSAPRPPKRGASYPWLS
jgi:hypothetical protein